MVKFIVSVIYNISVWSLGFSFSFGFIWCWWWYICEINVLLLILGEFEIEIEIWILSISVMNYIDSEFCCVKWFIGKFVELVEIF